MKTYPVLQSQLGVILHCMRHPNSTQYNLPNYIYLPQTIEKERLLKAYEIVLNEVPELRTRFMLNEKGEVRQWSDPTMKIPVVFRKSTDAELRDYVRNRFVRPFNLISGEPLFRLEVVETEKGLCMVTDGHHSISDGMTFTPILNDVFSNAYNGEHYVAPDYGMYQAAEDEEASFGTDAYLRAKEYYAKKFEGLEMTTLSHSTPGSMGKMGRRSAYINRKECDEWCQAHATQPNLLFQAAFGYVMAVLTRKEKVAYFTVNHGRIDKRLRNSVGMFVKSSPVLADANPDQKVIDFIKIQRTEFMSTIRYGIYPFSHFCVDLNMTPGVMFNFQALPGMEELLHLSEGGISAVQPVRGEVDSDIGVLIFFKGDDYEIRVESSLAMNDEATMQMVADAIKATIKNMMAAPDACLRDIAIVAPEAREALIALGAGQQPTGTPEGNSSLFTLHSSLTLVALLRKQAARTPDATAVVFRDRQLTYRQLDEITDRLAAHLVNHYGVQPDEAVGVMIDRSELMAVYSIAIMKAGAAYMPLDFQFPAERLQYMCDDAGVRLILSEDLRVSQSLPTFQGEVFTMDNEEWRMENYPLSIINYPLKSTGRYVILYTSGSTGQPKGVALEHRNIVNFCHWYIRQTGLSASDHVSAHATYGFDCHMMEMFPALTVGATLYIIPSEMRLEIEAINQYFEANNITVAFLTTQVGHLFASNIKNRSLRLLVVAGEKLLPLKYPGYRIINGYGPTEATILTTYCTIDADYDRPNIGRPLDGYHVYVVDKNMQLVPRCADGELVVGGMGVGRGYLNPSEKDADKFFNYMGGWCYRTGDLVRWAPDGNLEFMGRIDNQVKIRGYRIEMGEIEACASTFSGIHAAAAQAIKGQAICLYFTAAEPIDTDILKQYIADRLASYMVPTLYMQLDTMPLNANGKIDRHRLPIPEMTLEVKNVAPRTEKESELLKIAREVIGRDDIGVTDDLSLFGLTSIGAIRIAAMAAAKGIKISVNDMMRQHTVESAFIANTTPGYWVNGYGDARAAGMPEQAQPIAKPVLVVVHGIVFTASMQERFKQWQDHFSIYTIEPIDEHADKLFANAEFTDVIDYYAEMIERDIPASARVFAFLGYSFGGELAYWLAQRWQQQRGYAPNVYMGDSHIGNKISVTTEEEALQFLLAFAKDHPDDLDAMGIKASDTQYASTALHLAVKKFIAVSRLYCNVPYPHYDGHVTLFNALRENPDLNANIERWQSVAPNLQTVDIDDHHLNVMLSNKHTSLITQHLLHDAAMR